MSRYLTGFHGEGHTPGSVFVIEDFESGDISDYGGDTGDFSIQSTTVYQGSNALTDSNTDGSVISATDAAYTVSAPVRIHCRMALDGGDFGGIYWFTQAEAAESSNSGYLFQPHRGGGDPQQARLLRLDSGSLTQLATADSGYNVDGTFGLIEVDHLSDGSITVTTYNSSGSQANQLSASDTNYSSGGIGFRQGSNSGEYWDWVTAR